MFDFPPSQTETRPMTMSDLIATIGADPALSAARRRNVASSIRRFCAVLDCDPEQTEVTFEAFRNKLTSFHPAAAGIKKRRWQTIKSDVSFALRRVGAPLRKTRPRIPLGPVWDALKSRAASEHLDWKLSRLARFADARGLAPQDVNDDVMAEYAAFVRTRSFKTKPERHQRAVCVTWNKVATRCPDLGLQTLTVHSHRDLYTRPWNELPDDLRMEAESWLKSMSEEADLLAEDGPIRPLRPASVKSYSYAIRQIVAALLARGWQPEQLDSLACVVDPAAAKAVLEYFIDRNGGERSATAANVAHVLVLIAETHVKAEPEVVALLKRYRKKLNIRGHGMRPKPKAALRPFIDHANIEKILILPCKIYDRLRRKSSWTIEDARLMRVAVALELLLMRPIRRGNLVELRLGKHVIRAGGSTCIVIPTEDVKNKYVLDYPIPSESATLLTFYTRNLLPLFGSNPEGFLFPGAKPGSSMADEQFGRFFTKKILEETGLSVYPHLLRHFGAKIYLQENPGAFEIVRRVLGHKSLTTTTRSYADMEDEAAVRMFDQLVLGIRATICREIDGD